MKRPSPALVISILALFIALGGTSYAVTQLPKNSVGTAQLKKNAVTGAKVKDGSLSGADVDVATLGTVPAASSSNRANSAQTADRAASAGAADTAGTANSAATAGSALTADRAGSAATADKAISADTAKTADKATSADSATNATNAANATNAQTLGGKTAAELIQESKLRCPATMKLAAGVCIDEAPRSPAPLYGAFQVCGEENFRLPTQGELIAFVNQYVSGSLTEWIEPEVVSDNQFMGVLLTASKVEYSPSTFERASNQPYRCVTAASN
ncbi:MAG TPA: hypothetical protein VEW07_05815 [Solirubrobacterales bacterium]|nr:hypothetical protein [Solirubrobacterales bacterium]